MNDQQIERIERIRAKYRAIENRGQLALVKEDVAFLLNIIDKLQAKVPDGDYAIIKNDGNYTVEIHWSGKVSDPVSYGFMTDACDALAYVVAEACIFDDPYDDDEPDSEIEDLKKAWGVRSEGEE